MSCKVLACSVKTEKKFGPYLVELIISLEDLNELSLLQACQKLRGLNKLVLSLWQKGLLRSWVYDLSKMLS